ncbi:MAG: ubiquinol-cytochrome C chaperone [Phycisphaerales bacterium]|nr:ubiquinol-cytochrome C chaperone [Hyphomonadaceae bacterium]
MAAVTAVSRNPAFFGQGRVPDTLEGRFEVMTLNAALALMRLQAEPDLRPLAQAFTDQLFRQFDSGLRETGVSDTAVPKRMHKLASSFYGRLGAYSASIEAADVPALADAISRNTRAHEAEPLAAYVLAVAQAQGARPALALLETDGWPAPPR